MSLLTSYLCLSISSCFCYPFFFFFNDPATTEIYTLSLHDALPISLPCDQSSSGTTRNGGRGLGPSVRFAQGRPRRSRSEEHTSELQSHVNLVCRLLLEKKKHKKYTPKTINKFEDVQHYIATESSAD